MSKRKDVIDGWMDEKLSSAVVPRGPAVACDMTLGFGLMDIGNNKVKYRYLKIVLTVTTVLK